MMATSAPGPVPVPVAQQPISQQPHITMRSGHHRQPSATNRASAGGRPSTSGVAGGPSSSAGQYRPGGGGAGGGAGAPSSSQPQQAQRIQIVPAAGRPTTAHGPQASGAAGPSGTQRSPARGTAPRQPAAQPAPSQQQQADASNPPLNPSAGGSSATADPGARSSFPHAFERWEMLSSRWEGLTGYWVSRLEGNRQELSHLPLEQEMSRQITDLAAAGANLFQALIELQRLRASSERKFQRWFFETRADQERAREMSSELERTLRIERQKRADAMTAMQQCEKDKATAEKLAQEAQRELQISKEECRRAWEELGRREQEERERINQLREGHPTLIGGVQVIAMPMPGVPSRSGSTAARPRTATGAGPTSSAATFAPQTSQQQGDYDTQQSVVSQTGSASPTQSRTRQQQGDYNTSTTPTPASPSSSFYQQQPPNIHDRLDPRGASGAPPANPSPVSYITNPMGSPTISAVSGISDAFETDEHGNVVTDGNGNPIYAQRSRRHQESDRRQRAREQEEEERQWGNYPSYEGEEWGTTAGGPIGDAPEAASSGTSGYGRNGGGATDQGGVPVLQQEAVWAVGSHHHPTRLSNIEEERETASEIGTR